MFSWIREHTLAALTLIGLLFYGGALLAYSDFYGGFGVDPEEAGVDYTTTLIRAFPAFVSWLFSFVVLSPDAPRQSVPARRHRCAPQGCREG